MPTTGTENAAIIWRLAHSNGAPISESEVREATGLGVGTINRLMRTMAAQGYMVRHEAVGGDVTRYSTRSTIEQVRAAFSRRPVECKPRRPADTVTLSHFGPHIRRVASVWELGAQA